MMCSHISYRYGEIVVATVWKFLWQLIQHIEYPVVRRNEGTLLVMYVSLGS